MLNPFLVPTPALLRFSQALFLALGPGGSLALLFHYTHLFDFLK